MKNPLWSLLLFSFSTTAVAGTGLNCSEIINRDSSDNQLEACFDQTNNELNATYKQLRHKAKGWKEKLDALKNMQRGWMKMRDSQCLFQSMNSAGGSGAARAALRCEIEMTIKREKALSEL